MSDDSRTVLRLWETNSCAAYLDDENRYRLVVDSKLFGLIEHVIKYAEGDLEPSRPASNAEEPNVILEPLIQDEVHNASSLDTSDASDATQLTPPSSVAADSVGSTSDASSLSVSAATVYDFCPQATSSNDAAEALLAPSTFMRLFSDDELGLQDEVATHSHCVTTPTPTSARTTTVSSTPAVEAVRTSQHEITASASAVNDAPDLWSCDNGTSRSSRNAAVHHSTGVVAPMDVACRGPNILRECIAYEDSETERQLSIIGHFGWLDDGEDMVVINPMRRGISDRIAYGAMSHEIEPFDTPPDDYNLHPLFIWVCSNQALAYEAFGKLQAMKIVLSQAGMPSLSTGLITPDTWKYVGDWEIFNERPDALVITEQELVEYFRQGSIGFSRVKKFVLDNLTMLLSSAIPEQRKTVLRDLDPEHNVVVLTSELAVDSDLDSRLMTATLGRPLEKMPCLPDNRDELFKAIAQNLKFETCVGGRVDQAKYAVSYYLTGRDISQLSGNRVGTAFQQRRILALCDYDILREEVTVANSSSVDSYPFGHAVPTVHWGLMPKRNYHAVKQFVRGEVGSLLTTQHYIHGFNWDFVPTLMFLHLPDDFDTPMCMFQWYRRLYSNQETRLDTSVGDDYEPHVHIIYGKEDARKVELLQCRFKMAGIDLELPHQRDLFYWDPNESFRHADIAKVNATYGHLFE